MLRLPAIVIVGFFGLTATDRASGQQRTTPPTLDFTCHGYLEPAEQSRGYNCIPVASQQPSMETFVPIVGSTCDGGRVREFPAGRIVFQIRCQDPPANTDYIIGEMGQVDSILDDANWLQFSWYSTRTLRENASFRIRAVFYHANNTTTCYASWVGPERGQQIRELMIPGTCTNGYDEEWTRVVIEAVDGYRCHGCGDYQSPAIPEENALASPDQVTALEVPTLIEEFSLRVQTAATNSRPVR